MSSRLTPRIDGFFFRIEKPGLPVHSRELSSELNECSCPTYLSHSMTFSSTKVTATIHAGYSLKYVSKPYFPPYKLVPLLIGISTRDENYTYAPPLLISLSTYFVCFTGQAPLTTTVWVFRLAGGRSHTPNQLFVSTGHSSVYFVPLQLDPDSQWKPRQRDRNNERIRYKKRQMKEAVLCVTPSRAC